MVEKLHLIVSYTHCFQPFAFISIKLFCTLLFSTAWTPKQTGGMTASHCLPASKRVGATAGFAGWFCQLGPAPTSETGQPSSASWGRAKAILSQLFLQVVLKRSYFSKQWESHMLQLASGADRDNPGSYFAAMDWLKNISSWSATMCCGILMLSGSVCFHLNQDTALPITIESINLKGLPQLAAPFCGWVGGGVRVSDCT